VCLFIEILLLSAAGTQHGLQASAVALQEMAARGQLAFHLFNLWQNDPRVRTSEIS